MKRPSVFSLFAGLLTLSAATGCHKDAEDTGASATLEILAPLDGEQVTAGEVVFSVVVEGFSLVTPAKHEEGEALAGWIIAAVDGTDVATDGDTQVALTLDTVGSHTVALRLELEDGDPLDPPAEDAVTLEVVAP
jgi:hypothetical protein